MSYLKRHNVARISSLIAALLAVLIMGGACGGAGENATPDQAASASPATVPSAAAPATLLAEPSPEVTTTPLSEPQPVAPSRTGILRHPRGGWHTATLLQDGRVLVVGGLPQPFVSSPDIETLKSAETFDPVIGSWAPASRMGLTRAGHTATLLSDGTVLVVGGLAGARAPWRSTAEVYDALKDPWARTGKLDPGRGFHAATRLVDGRVLVAGGPNYESAAVYDPSTGTWSSTGNLVEGRLFHTLTLPEDGRVLAVGGMRGFGSGATNIEMAEMYAPPNGTWTEAGRLQQERRWHTATLLEDSTVLIVGGMTADYEALQSAEIYEPTSGTWTPTGSMSQARALHTATGLPDGRVLVAGGLRERESDEFGVYVSGPPLASAEVYDPSTGTWSPVESMSEKRAYHVAVLLADGRVLVIGGTGEGQLMLDSTELFAPASAIWASPGSEQ